MRWRVLAGLLAVALLSAPARGRAAPAPQVIQGTVAFTVTPAPNGYLVVATLLTGPPFQSKCTHIATDGYVPALRNLPTAFVSPTELRATLTDAFMLELYPPPSHPPPPGGSVFLVVLNDCLGVGAVEYVAVWITLPPRDLTATPVVPELPPLASFGAGLLALGALAVRGRRGRC